ncbi:hypothetical protein NMG60_11020911 [Bertholletia excelsa]
MGSLGGEVANKATWLYPKIAGFNPSERWGHSACYSNGLIYVFGGCCGGLHFSDVSVLNLDTMAWITLATTGKGPGPRDSHSAVLVGQKMMVFGGTNGVRKVNDLHVLDLASREWTKPDCTGAAPSPRESHTATLVGEEKLVVFGGSGEGEANYLNDLHVLDLKTMRWTSPKVKGNVPVPRDSHSAVAIGSKIFVYGGDCGDRYEGDIDVLDMETLTWSRLIVQGSSPGVRAGHAAVNIGNKVYIIGGVGDQQYYNDVWVLDVNTCSWIQLKTCGRQPQGRFSHSAIVTEMDIAIYGGCGEDEHPINEFLVLQLRDEHSNGDLNISSCKIFGKRCDQEKTRISREQRTMLLGSNRDVARKEACGPELESKRSLQIYSDAVHWKRRRMSNSKTWEVESEPEEHSLSLSQHSSPSQSDQELTPAANSTNPVMASHVFPLIKQQIQVPCGGHPNVFPSNQTNPRNFFRRNPRDFHFLREQPNLSNSEQNLHVVHMGRSEAQRQAADQKPLEAGAALFPNMVGAEIRGKVDGAFDSGYLMTAIVNGKIFRGVLFAPGPEVVPRATILGQNTSSLTSQRANVAQPCPCMNHTSPLIMRTQQNLLKPFPPAIKGVSSNSRELSPRSDLQGVVLTLGGPGAGQGGS